jgi:hypothetical protein
MHIVCIVVCDCFCFYLTFDIYSFDIAKYMWDVTLEHIPAEPVPRGQRVACDAASRTLPCRGIWHEKAEAILKSSEGFVYGGIYADITRRAEIATH